MNKSIDELYKLIYLPLITPYNLLDNIKLDNYNSIRYFKDKNTLVVELKCLVDNYEEKTYRYLFDEGEMLQRIDIMEEGFEVELFSRENELTKVLEKIKEIRDFELVV